MNCRPAIYGMGFLLWLSGCQRGPASSTTFPTAAQRASWMSSRLVRSAPGRIADAHFREIESRIPGGHGGMPYSMWWLYAKIEIDPAELKLWQGSCTPATPNRHWLRELNPLHSPQQDWTLPPDEFDDAAWYDPAALFDTGAHSGYQAGHLLINKAGTTVYVWQHWR